MNPSAHSIDSVAPEKEVIVREQVNPAHTAAKWFECILYVRTDKCTESMQYGHNNNNNNDKI